MFWDSQYSPSQLGTLLGVAVGLGSLSNTGQYCLGEGWFADVLLHEFPHMPIIFFKHINFVGGECPKVSPFTSLSGNRTAKAVTCHRPTMVDLDMLNDVC